MRLMPSLEDCILDILKQWNDWWYGYEQLEKEIWEIRPSENDKEIRKAMKNLKEKGFVVHLHTINEATGLINGSGWFLNLEKL